MKHLLIAISIAACLSCAGQGINEKEARKIIAEEVKVLKQQQAYIDSLQYIQMIKKDSISDKKLMWAIGKFFEAAKIILKQHEHLDSQLEAIEKELEKDKI